MTEVVKSDKTNITGQTANRATGFTNTRKTKEKESASKIVQAQLSQQTNKRVKPIVQMGELTPVIVEKEPT
jgi:hypothetical protein